MLTITPVSTTARLTSDARVFAVFQGEPVEHASFFSSLPAGHRRYLRTFAKAGFFSEKDETDFIVFPNGKPAAGFLIGLGKRRDWNHRRAALFFRRLVGLAASQKMTSLTVHLPSLLPSEMDEEALARLATENLLLADYRFGRFQKQPKPQRKLQRVELVAASATAKKAVHLGKQTAAYVNLCRDLVNTPASRMTPSHLSHEATRLARATGCRIRVLGRTEMEKEKMGGALGVSRGSAEEPKFVVMEYFGASKHEAPLVFVGKGVTFDAGGINLKSSQAMTDMHMDMSGAAAAICATAAIAERKLPVNVVAIVPAVENMPSGTATKPGDVLSSRAGISIEVVDTDAEGRIILADALDYAKRYKPTLLVDLATLTGAAAVALGLRLIALFTPNQSTAQQFVELGEQSGDYLWPMPVQEEYEQEIKGTVGDLANVGKVRYGGAIHGALFLKRFVGNFPWAHLDIAPTMTSAEGQYLAKGATGTGVRLLIRLAEERSKIKSKR